MLFISSVGRAAEQKHGGFAVSAVTTVWGRGDCFPDSEHPLTSEISDFSVGTWYL